MKKILLIIFALVFSIPVATTVNATESVQQSVNNDWEVIGYVALYKGEGDPGSWQYQKYAGEATVYMKNIQGFRTYKVRFNGKNYFPSKGKYTLRQNPNTTDWVEYNCKIGNNYYCNL